MKHIVAIGASNSSQSINKQLATWAANQLDQVKVTILDLNEFEMPIYSIEREQEHGIPSLAKEFKDIIKESDGIIISFAEHNGSYTSAFKNIFDWVSRLPESIWLDTPMLLLATSPGPRGAQSVLNTASSSFPYQGGQVVGSFSLPSFGKNFNPHEGITNQELKESFDQQMSAFKQQIAEAPAAVSN